MEWQSIGLAMYIISNILCGRIFQNKIYGKENKQTLRHTRLFIQMNIFLKTRKIGNWQLNGLTYNKMV